MRGRLEVSQRENSTLRREKNDLEAQVTHISKTYHGMRPRKDSSLEQQDDPREQVRERERVIYRAGCWNEILIYKLLFSSDKVLKISGQIRNAGACHAKHIWY